MSTKLAAAALAMGVLAFVHLFGVEKAVMAVAFGAMALKDPAISPRGAKLAKAAVVTGLGYLALAAGVFIYHTPAVSALVSRLAK